MLVGASEKGAFSFFFLPKVKFYLDLANYFARISQIYGKIIIIGKKWEHGNTFKPFYIVKGTSIADRSFGPEWSTLKVRGVDDADSSSLIP